VLGIAQNRVKRIKNATDMYKYSRLNSECTASIPVILILDQRRSIYQWIAVRETDIHWDIIRWGALMFSCIKLSFWYKTDITIPMSYQWQSQPYEMAVQGEFAFETNSNVQACDTYW
jgi:hypothetical protein